MRSKHYEKRKDEKLFAEYFGLILQGNPEDFQQLKEYITNHTSLKIKYIKSSRFYLLIQPAPLIKLPPPQGRVKQ